MYSPTQASTNAIHTSAIHTSAIRLTLAVSIEGWTLVVLSTRNNDNRSKLSRRALSLRALVLHPVLRILLHSRLEIRISHPLADTMT